MNTSVACGECEPGTRMTLDGPCVECTDANYWLLALAAIVLVGVLACVYVSIARENRATEKMVVALAAIVVSQMLTMLQMMNVLELSVEWPDPFATILSFVSVFNFRWELLNYGCVFPVPAFTRYVLTVFSFLVLLLLMLSIHIFHVIVFHWAKFKARQFREFSPVLIGAVGTIFMTVFISVSSAVAAPLLCEKHPNGEHTVHSYPQVICWRAAHQEHKAMLIVGASVSVVPLGFLTMCCWVVRSLPGRLRSGDTAFLHSFAFLFFRFRPGSYWYVLVLVMRNSAVALAPIIAEDSLELVLLVMVLLPCVILCSIVFPWRLFLANLLDLAINGGFLLMLFLGALFVDNANKTLIGDLLVVILFFVWSVFLVVACYCIVVHCWNRRGKTYSFFLCHHKEGAGGFARLLKMCLQRSGHVRRDVFLDSDNLQDLSKLFSIVGNHVETLVVLCTEKILTRPWCVGEMTNARLRSLDVFLIIFPNFQSPSEDFISNYERHLDGVEMVAAHGIGIDMMRDTLRWLPSLPHIVLPSAMTGACLTSVMGKLVARKGGKRELSPVLGVQSIELDDFDTDILGEESEETGACESWKVYGNQCVVEDRPGSLVPMECRVVSVVDHSNWEAVCAALIIQELMKPFSPLLCMVPHVLGADETMSDAVTIVLVICSSGCFQRAAFVQQLMEAASRRAGVVPIIIEKSFDIPKTYATDCFELAGTEPDQVAFLVQSIFENIAIYVIPQDAEEILLSRSWAIWQRLTNRNLALLRDPSSDNFKRVQSEERQVSTACSSSATSKPALLTASYEAVNVELKGLRQGGEGVLMSCRSDATSSPSELSDDDVKLSFERADSGAITREVHELRALDEHRSLNWIPL